MLLCMVGGKESDIFSVDYKPYLVSQRAVLFILARRRHLCGIN